VNEYTSASAGLAGSGGYGAGGLITATDNSRSGAQGVLIDGAGAAWVAVKPCAGAATCTDHIVGLPANVHTTNAGITPSAGLALPYGETGAHALALDGSGNLWVAVADGSLIQYVGLTTPVATPLLAGKIGTTP
jgi:hypothetical protein